MSYRRQTAGIPRSGERGYCVLFNLGEGEWTT